MDNPPPRTFLTEHHRAAPESLGVVEFECGENDAWRQAFNAKIDRNELLVRWAADGVTSHLGENREKRGIDGRAPSDALRYRGRGIKDGGGIREGRAERFPIEILERGEESMQGVGNGGRIGRAITRRAPGLGAEREGKC